jgi:arylsulfatase A-like enzyme
VRAISGVDPRDAPPPEIVWQAPIAAIFGGVIVAVLLAVVLRARRGLSIRVPTAVFAAASMYAVILNMRIGFQRLAILVLAAGLGIQIARWLARHVTGYRTVVRRTAPGLAGLLVLALVGTTGFERVRERIRVASLPPAAPGSPNVLLLILDTVRKSNLSVYGYERETSPEIAAFARTGVTFDAAIATAPWTLPSHGSMFTGRPAHELSTDFDTPLDEEYPTLAEVLAARGYATAGFAANQVYCTTASGLDRGFAVYRDHLVSVKTTLRASRWTEAVIAWIRPRLGMHTRLRRKTAEQINRDFLGWLSGNEQRPFFAFLNYFDAHHPYQTTPPFDRRFTDRPPRYWLNRGWLRDTDPADIQERIDAYDSSIAYLDDQVGQLLDELDSRGILDNTLVVIAGDHGELFGEHGIFVHGNSLYLPLLQVPLIMSFPARLPAGQRISRPVTIRDIPATIMDVIGAPSAAPLAGETLAPLWQTGAGDRALEPSEPLLSELTPNMFGHPKDPTRRGLMNSVIDDSLHYILNGDGVEELYNWRADPDETTNLAETSPGHPGLQKMRDFLEKSLAANALTSTVDKTASNGTPHGRRR